MENNHNDKTSVNIEGTLQKWVNLVYQWQPRYFILHGDTLLYCEKKGEPPKGKMHLAISTIKWIPDDPLRIIIHSGTFEVHLKAENISEQKKWFHALNEAQQEALLSSQQQDAYQNLAELAQSLPPVIRQYLVTPNTEKINDKLAQIWVLQAQLDETISMVTPRMEKSGPLKEQFEKIAQVSSEMKVNK